MFLLEKIGLAHALPAVVTVPWYIAFDYHSRGGGCSPITTDRIRLIIVHTGFQWTSSRVACDTYVLNF